MDLINVLKWKPTHPNGKLLAPQQPGDVGYDLVVAEFNFWAMRSRVFVNFGVAIELPEGYHAEVVPRSGTFRKYGLILTNSVGVIDNGYRGTLAADFLDTYKETDFPSIGDRIAQLIIRKSEVMPLQQVTELTETERGTGGFGSTGK